MNLSKDRLIVSTSQKRSIQKCRDSLPIPTELVVEIFSRLPPKSITRYWFLSKFWFNVFQSQYFIDLFAAKSSARPQILFLERNASGISFSSAHQPSENSSDNITPAHLRQYPTTKYASRYQYGVPINGLVCVSEGVGGINVPTIYNPSTGDVLTLPKMKIQGRCPEMRNFLGYDPTEKQFKVLSVGYYNETSIDYQVLTLETKVMSWRRIECSTPHCALGRVDRGICINGVLYYHARGLLDVQLIVCFDVRYETFRFIKPPTENQYWERMLTNYDGKLAFVMSDKESKSFEIWLLEKDEWSKHGYYVLPPSWKDLVGETSFMFVGMIGTNEIVFSLASHHRGFVHKHPYIFYFNIEKNTIRKFNIQVMGSSKYRQVFLYLNYVEDVYRDHGLSRDAWRCVWHMIQNDLVHGWGLDFALRKCVEPAHEKIGVVDSQWIIHQSLPSLGSQGEEHDGKAAWQGVRDRCKREWTMFHFQSPMARSKKKYLKEIANSTTH